MNPLLTAIWSYITSVVAQLGMMHAVTQEHNYPKVVYTEMLVDMTEVKFQIHSGALVNVISVDFVADKKFEPTTKTLQMWNTKATGFLSINSSQSKE